MRATSFSTVDQSELYSHSLVMRPARDARVRRIGLYEGKPEIVLRQVSQLRALLNAFWLLELSRRMPDGARSSTVHFTSELHETVARRFQENR